MNKESDFMVRAVMQDQEVRIVFGNFAALCAAGIVKHDADPLSGRLLAETLVSAALMSVLLNETERFSIGIDYPGAARGILADVTGNGDVRGLIRNVHLLAETDSVDEACGSGSTVSVTKSEAGRILNSGQSQSSFIMPSAALSYFLSVSDQVESEIRCGIVFNNDPLFPVSSANSIMLQALPGCDLEFFNRMRERLFSDEVGAVLSDPAVVQEKKLDAVMMILCDTPVPPELEVTRVPVPRFFCSCSGKRIWQSAESLLGAEEFAKLLQENPDPVIKCQFCGCGHHYRDL